MNLTDPILRLNLSATGLDPFPLAGGSIEIGTRITERLDSTANLALSARISLGATGENLELDLTDLSFTGSVAPVAQVETATAAGTVTASGNAAVTVTSALFDADVVLSVPVLNTDTPSAWATKVRAALAADPTVSASFAVSGATDAIILTALAETYNDATLNIALATGTATGITAAPTSANTTAGVHGVQWSGYSGNGNDVFGATLPIPAHIHGLALVVVSGPAAATLGDGAGGVIQSTLPIGATYLISGVPVTDLAATTITIERTGTGNTPLVADLILIAGPAPA